MVARLAKTEKSNVMWNPVKRRLQRDEEVPLERSRRLPKALLLELEQSVGDSIQNRIAVTWVKRNPFGYCKVEPITGLMVKFAIMGLQEIVKTGTETTKQQSSSNLRDPWASSDDNLFRVAVFFANASLKLWYPAGILKANGRYESVDGIFYRLFQISEVTALMISVAVGFCLLKWKPTTRREKRKQIRVVETLIWVGLVVFLLGYMAGYFMVNGNPFTKGVLAAFVPILIGVFTIVVVAAGIIELGIW